MHILKLMYVCVELIVYFQNPKEANMDQYDAYFMWSPNKILWLVSKTAHCTQNWYGT